MVVEVVDVVVCGGCGCCWFLIRNDGIIPWYVHVYVLRMIGDEDVFRRQWCCCVHSCVFRFIVAYYSYSSTITL